MNPPAHRPAGARRRHAASTRPRWLAVIALCAASVVASVFASAPAAAARVPGVMEMRTAMSLDEAADQVRGAYGGQVIAASPTRSGGREGYRIRVILDDGRVITVFVDAETGAMRQTG